jgi:hypothetical protein
MKKTQNATDDSSRFRFIRITIAIILSVAGGIIIYEPLASLNFDFIFFEDISINKVAGSWSNVVKYLSSAVLGVLTGISYYICERRWKMPFIACLPLALFFGAIGMGVTVVVIGAVVAVLATIVLILALLFGRGDR